VQAVGRKRVLLWPPACRELLRAPPAGEPLENSSPIDAAALERLAECGDGAELEATGGDHNLQKLRTACVSAVLEPGDAVLIPQGWWHGVVSLSVSFSVSFWWDHVEGAD
jgi:mitochondrial division protein 1